MSEDAIEFTSRGKRQLKSLIYDEIKEQIDVLIEPMVTSMIEKRINTKLESFMSNSKIEELVKQRIDGNYWKTYDKMIRKSNFQEMLKEEIITYLHKRWACGITPFETEFNNALMKALKELIK